MALNSEIILITTGIRQICKTDMEYRGHTCKRGTNLYITHTCTLLLHETSLFLEGRIINVNGLVPYQ